MLSSRGFIGCSTGIAQAEANAFSVYPNPTNGQFTLVSEWNAAQATIQITDLSGKMVFQSNQALVAGQPIAFDLNGIHSGLYIVSVTEGMRSQYTKLLVE